MNAARCGEILDRLPSLRIGVVGDFFLDKYLVTDPALSEESIETGLEARQVVAVRCTPGAAGTVTSNLSALGVGRLEAIGVIGDDGEGYELLRGLAASRVGTSGLLRDSCRFTPTYTKPMVREHGGERELERLDIKNRSHLPAPLAEAIIAHLDEAVSGLDALIVADQVQEPECGVVTSRLREHLAEVGAAHPGVHILADSRVRIGLFRGVIIKPNLSEAAAAMGWSGEPPGTADVGRVGSELARQNGRPAFITLGPSGVAACTPDQVDIMAPPALRGPIDIVGAGDSTAAGIVCALCAGASPAEAAEFGNLCASVTIHKLGCTGTASPEEVLSVLANAKASWGVSEGRGT